MVVGLHEIYIASALFYYRDSVSAFRVKFGANDLNCVVVPLNPTHSLTRANDFTFGQIIAQNGES